MASWLRLGAASHPASGASPLPFLMTPTLRCVYKGPVGRWKDPRVDRGPGQSGVSRLRCLETREGGARALVPEDNASWEPARQPPQCRHLSWPGLTGRPEPAGTMSLALAGLFTLELTLGMTPWRPDAC